MPGKDNGSCAPKQFGADAQIQTRQMTVKDIISSIPGVPYYNNVVDDWDAKDYSWGVTKKVIEYATYLKDHPESLAKLPPAIVLNGKFEDGAHRVSAIWLLQQRMDPKNPLWKNVKLNVQFVKQGMTEGEEITEGPFVQRLGRPNKVNIYVRHTTGKPSLLIATDIPYSIYDKFIAKAMQKYPQFRQTDFSFKSADKLKEETKLSESADYLDEN